MALSVLIKSSRKLPVFCNLTTNFTKTQFKNNLFLSPIVARDFTGFSRPVTEHKYLAVHNAQIVQRRNITHSSIWAAEKILSVALLGVIPACIAFPSLVTDNILATAVVVHMHWGVESVVVDYIRPVLFGNIIPKIAHFLVYFVSAFTLGGLIYFNYNDVGLAKAIKKIWAIKGSDGSEVKEDPKDQKKGKKGVAPPAKPAKGK